MPAMTKIYLFVVLLCLGLSGSAQEKRIYTLSDMPFEVDSVTGGVVYRGVVQVDGASQIELYNRARTFLLKALTNAGAQVIQIDEKENGLLSAKGQITKPMTAAGFIMGVNNQTTYEMPVEIRVKDGR